MRLGAVEQVTTQVDHFHGVPLSGSWTSVSGDGAKHARILRPFASWKRFLNSQSGGKARQASFSD
jgi:hypothetical protein